MRHLSTLVAVLAVLVFGGATQAAPITGFSIQYLGNPGAGASGSSFTSSLGLLTAQTPSSPNILFSTSSDATVDFVDVTSTIMGPTTIYNGFANVNFGTGDFSVNTPFGVAIFDLTNPAILSGTQTSPFPATSIFLNQTAVLTTNPVGSPGLFGTPGQFWTFSFATTGVSLNPGSPGTFSVATTSTLGLTASSTGQFVPEPATLAVCGFFGIAGLVAARRKVKKTAEPTVAA